jgi:hypothetical protein
MAAIAPDHRPAMTMPALIPAETDASAAIKAGALKVACSSCNLRELCLPVGFSEPELQRLDTLVATRRGVKRGEALFRWKTRRSA